MPSKWKQFLHGLYQSNLYYNPVSYTHLGLKNNILVDSRVGHRESTGDFAIHSFYPRTARE